MTGPGAEVEFAQPVEVTGTLESGECSTPDHRGEGNQDVLPGANTLWTCVGPATASDARLAGTSTFLTDGQWFRGNGLEAPERLAAGCDADSEGLVAVLEVTGDGAYDFSDNSHDLWGYILDARQSRPAPESASAR